MMTFSATWTALVDALKAQAVAIGVPAERIEKGQTGRQGGKRPYVRVFLVPSAIGAQRTGRSFGVVRTAEVAIICAADGAGDVATAVERVMTMAAEVYKVLAPLDYIGMTDDTIEIVKAESNEAMGLISCGARFSWPS